MCTVLNPKIEIGGTCIHIPFSGNIKLPGKRRNLTSPSLCPEVLRILESLETLEISENPLSKTLEPCSTFQ